ncbi:hypothetical protein BX616_004935 [Lobosporangium transversale]|nr:hypothetical protein BX616_004935 [Lobosporangium transversale]
MPIKGIRWIENDQSGSTPMLVTGSWDKTIRLWDLRQKNPTMTVALPERLYAMDSLFPILVAGTAERHVVVYNLYNLSKPFKALTSPLKWQTRTVSCFAGGDGSGYGYGLGSIEGRVAIEYIEDQHRGKSYTFRCHRQGSIREPQNIYSVNSINWHPIHQRVFTTAGSDGVFSFWDRDGKMKLKAFPPVQGPISSTAFNRTGTIFAYAVSYEWNKGYAGARQQTQNKIMIHPIDESEMKLFQVGRR